MTIPKALDWLSDNNIPLPADLHLVLEQKGLLKNYKRQEMKQAESIEDANKEYHDAITETLTSYFEDGGSVTSYKNNFKKAMVEAFGSTFDLGWTDGGQEMPPDDEALEWLNARVDTEFGYIEELFQQAKALRKEEGVDWFAWVSEKADSYTSTLASIYNSAGMWANKNQMLGWELGDTETHCDTCVKLDGQRHKASWYLARDYIPRKPGAAMKCKGYNCDCKLKNKQGEEITI